MDVHLAGTYPVNWTRVDDNIWDTNPLAALPSGIGLSFLFNGSDGTITTTTAGVWAFTANLSNAPPDATFKAYLTEPFGGFSQPAMPAAPAGPSLEAVYFLPSGANGAFDVIVTANSTANPYPVAVLLVITRLA